MKKNSKMVPIILLIVSFLVISIFLGGGTLKHFTSEFMPYILIFIIVSIVLMIVPFIFRLINKGKMNYKKGNKVCLYNSIILYIISSIPSFITLIKGEHRQDFSLDPVSFSASLIIVFLLLAVLYYFINMSLFVNKE